MPGPPKETALVKAAERVNAASADLAEVQAADNALRARFNAELAESEKRLTAAKAEIEAAGVELAAAVAAMNPKP